MSSPDQTAPLPYVAKIIGLTILLVGMVAAFVATFIVATDICLIIFLAVLFGVFLTKSGGWLAEHTSISHQVGVAAVATLLVVLTVGAFALFGVTISNQFDKASDHIDEGRAKLLELADKYAIVNSALSSTPYVKSLLVQAEEPGDNSAADDDKKESSDKGEDPEREQDQEEETEDRKEKDQGKEGDEEKNEDQEKNGGRVNESKGKKNSQTGSGMVGSVAKQGLQAILGVFKTTFGLIVNSLLIFFVGLFLAIAPASYRDGVVKLFPPHRRDRMRGVFNQLGDTLWKWLLGRFGSMLITGVGAAILLSILGVPMTLTLGLITGLLTFIPNIGGFVAFLLSMLFALPQGGFIVLMVLVGYLVLQLIESYVVTPLIQQKQVSLPPALLIAFQALMGVVFGFLGAVVASPMLAAGKVAVEEIYVKDLLESEGEN